MANAQRFCRVLTSLSSAVQRNGSPLWRNVPLRCLASDTKNFNKPISGSELPRSGGIATAFRLPFVQGDNIKDLDACFVGIPIDQGATNRSGQRLAPRAIRNESVMLRPVNMTGAVPFDSIQVADIGDVPTVPYNFSRTLDNITSFYRKVLDAGPVPLTLGGDHTLSLPVLRAFRQHYGRPVGLIQIDAHADLLDEMNGEKIGSLTPFRRALEEDLVDPKCMVQIGLRGTLQSENEIKEQFEWAQDQVMIYRISLPVSLCGTCQLIWRVWDFPHTAQLSRIMGFVYAYYIVYFPSLHGGIINTIDYVSGIGNLCIHTHTPCFSLHP